MYTLKKDSYFGENSLISTVERNFSVKVISDQAKCLKMTRKSWDNILSVPKKYQQESTDRILRLLCDRAMDQINLFSPLQPSQRQKLIDEMVHVNYSKGVYINKQGFAGNYLLIILSGTCKVTMFVNGEDEDERDIGFLTPGDVVGKRLLTIVSIKL